MLFEEKDIALFALGSMVSTGEHVREKLKARGYSCTLVNARFVKPLDTDMIDRLCRSHKLIVTLEENVLRGGMGMCATRYIHEHHPEIHVIQVLFQTPMWSMGTCRSYGKCWGSTVIR